MQTRLIKGAYTHHIAMPMKFTDALIARIAWEVARQTSLTALQMDNIKREFIAEHGPLTDDDRALCNVIQNIYDTHGYHSFIYNLTNRTPQTYVSVNHEHHKVIYTPQLMFALREVAESSRLFLPSELSVAQQPVAHQPSVTQ